jgi:hypothetical protein
MKSRAIAVTAALLVACGLAGTAPGDSAFPLDQTFQLHSDPGASKVIYLDFDGHTTTGTSWNNYTGGAAIVTPAFSTDGDSSFSDIELERIQYIWQRVAEDYNPFNVDVTTQNPGSSGIIKSSTGDSHYGIRVCIGGDSSWYPGAAIGGVAMMYGFGPHSDTPCFVFSDNLGMSDHGNEKYVAEAISHEAGHTLGLTHDGVSGGVEYYEGQGGWAPIMGVGYKKELTQWSKGEYAGANNHQDDLATITGSTGNFGYRVDDHGGTIASATGLAVAADMNVSGSGIIERTTDVDFFSFTTGPGLVRLWIDPPREGRTSTSWRPCTTVPARSSPPATRSGNSARASNSASWPGRITCPSTAPERAIRWWPATAITAAWGSTSSAARLRSPSPAPRCCWCSARWRSCGEGGACSARPPPQGRRHDRVRAYPGDSPDVHRGHYEQRYRLTPRLRPGRATCKQGS